MKPWSIEVYDDDYIVIYGVIPLTKFQFIVKHFTKKDWLVDMQWAKELDATFVICKPELIKQRIKNAVNQ